jgi:hypothetical protein
MKRATQRPPFSQARTYRAPPSLDASPISPPMRPFRARWWFLVLVGDAVLAAGIAVGAGRARLADHPAVRVAVLPSVGCRNDLTPRQDAKRLCRPRHALDPSWFHHRPGSQFHDFTPYAAFVKFQTLPCVGNRLPHTLGPEAADDLEQEIGPTFMRNPGRLYPPGPRPGPGSRCAKPWAR